ncbi:MAG: hypothetical protein ACOVNR_03595, partial [Chitinophagaceae bacterium]
MIQVCLPSKARYFALLFIFSALFFQVTEVNAQKRKKKTKSAKSASTKKKQSSKSSSAKKETVSAAKTTALEYNSALYLPEKKTVSTNNDDTLIQKEVLITSSFKPSLRNAAKINFNAATPLIDTNRIPLTYFIPSQNLFFNYQPVALKPLAYIVDTTYFKQNSGYIKAGLGNFSGIHAEFAKGFTDKKQNEYTINAKYLQAKGSMPLQNWKNVTLHTTAQWQMPQKALLQMQAGFAGNYRYAYGFDPTVLTPDATLLAQNFNHFYVNANLIPLKKTDYGLEWIPSVKTAIFWDNKKGTEVNFDAQVQLNKVVKDVFKLFIIPKASLTTLNTPNKNLSNNLWSIESGIAYQSDKFQFYGSALPIGDNKQFYLLPNIRVETNIASDKFVFYGQVKGDIQKNNYLHLATFNPFVQQLDTFFNTRQLALAAGFKGKVNKHFQYKAQLQWQNLTNAVVWLNNPDATKAHFFQPRLEEKLQAVTVSGELSYTLQDKLTVGAAAAFTQFTNQKSFTEAYGWLPLELTGTLRWTLFNEILLKTDILFFDGANFRNKLGNNAKLSAAIDVNAGLEVRLAKKVNGWFQLNNIFNNT